MCSAAQKGDKSINENPLRKRKKKGDDGIGMTRQSQSNQDKHGQITERRKKMLFTEMANGTFPSARAATGESGFGI
jgi:hypothetical protein